MVVSAALAGEPVALTWELELPTLAEPGPFGWGSEPKVHHYFLGDDLARRGAAGGTVDDGWFVTTCTLERRSVHLELSYRPDHYPEHLPEETSCTVGRYVVTVSIRPVAPLYTTPDELWWAPGKVVPLRLHAPTADGGLSVRTLTLGLPPEIPWVPASVPLRDAAGLAWGDGLCSVRPEPRPHALVKYDSHLHGEGTCTVTDASGATQVLHLRREDVPRDIAPP